MTKLGGAPTPKWYPQPYHCNSWALSPSKTAFYTPPPWRPSNCRLVTNVAPWVSRGCCCFADYQQDSEQTMDIRWTSGLDTMAHSAELPLLSCPERLDTSIRHQRFHSKSFSRHLWYPGTYGSPIHTSPQAPTRCWERFGFRWLGKHRGVQKRALNGGGPASTQRLDSVREIHGLRERRNQLARMLGFFAVDRPARLANNWEEKAIRTLARVSERNAKHTDQLK